MIDTEETGPCRTRSCSNVGKRARGAQDAEGLVSRTRVFEKSYYCEGCLEAAAQRVLSTSIRTLGRVQIPGGFLRLCPVSQPGDAPFGEN